MGDRGERVRLEGVRTRTLRTWRSGNRNVWTARSVTIRKVTDTRYLVDFDGRSDVVAGVRAYETLWQAEQVARQLMATPDAVGDYPEWVEG